MASNVGVNAQAIAVTDVDGNALQDIVVCFTAASSAFQPKISVVLQRALGQLEVVDTSLASLSGLDGFVVADLNGDGRPDVATTGFFPVGTPSTVRSRTNLLAPTVAGRYVQTATIDMPVPMSRINAIDVDGDTLTDLILLGDSNRAYVMYQSAAVARHVRRAAAAVARRQPVRIRVSHSATSTGLPVSSLSTVAFHASCAPPGTGLTSSSVKRPRTRLPAVTGAVKRTLLNPTLMPVCRSVTSIAFSSRRVSSDSVRKPWATVHRWPDASRNGDSRAARSGSTWIHWRSSIASANSSIIGCETAIQSLTATSVPARAASCSRDIGTGMRFILAAAARPRHRAIAEAVLAQAAGRGVVAVGRQRGQAGAPAAGGVVATAVEGGAAVGAGGLRGGRER